MKNILKIPKIITQSNGNITLSYKKPKFTLIWLHGFKDQPQSYVPFFTHSQSILYKQSKIKILQAPFRNLQKGGGKGCAWFDIDYNNRFKAPNSVTINKQHLEQSISYISKNVEQQEQFWKNSQNSKVDPQLRVFIGGFNQGGTMCLHYGYQHRPPAGIISIGGYLLQSTVLNNKYKIPTLLLNGRRDRIILQNQAKVSYSNIIQDDLVEYKSYEGQNEIIKDHINVIGEWICKKYKFIEEHFQREEAKKKQN